MGGVWGVLGGFLTLRRVLWGVEGKGDALQKGSGGIRGGGDDDDDKWGRVNDDKDDNGGEVTMMGGEP